MEENIIKPSINLHDNDEYIFISYSHKDLSLVYKCLDYLSNLGAVFWYDDQLELGDKWTEKAEAAISDEKCVGVLFFISKDALMSKPIVKEAQMTIKKGIDFGVVRIDSEGWVNEEWLSTNLIYDVLFSEDEKIFYDLKSSNIEDESMLKINQFFVKNHCSKSVFRLSDNQKAIKKYQEKNENEYSFTKDESENWLIFKSSKTELYFVSKYAVDFISLINDFEKNLNEIFDRTKSRLEANNDLSIFEISLRLPTREEVSIFEEKKYKSYPIDPADTKRRLEKQNLRIYIGDDENNFDNEIFFFNSNNKVLNFKNDLANIDLLIGIRLVLILKI